MEHQAENNEEMSLGSKIAPSKEKTRDSVDLD